MSYARLHLGCGLVHRPGWINLDRYVADAADLLADAILLPFPDNSAEAIEARQLIEHLGYVGAVYALHEWARVLIPGGSLLVETPDRAATLAAALPGPIVAAALPWLFGDEPVGQGHRYLFDAAELAQLATQVGFEAVSVDPIAGRPDHPTLRLTARRSADTPALRFAGRAHRGFVTSGVINPAGAPAYLGELETLCAQAGRLATSPGGEALLQLFSLAVRYSPLVAACLLRALPDPAAWPADDLARIWRLVTDLEQERFPARLAGRWRLLPKLPGATDAAWAALEREISLYLAARLYRDAGLDDLSKIPVRGRAAFDAAVAQPGPFDRAVVFLCRPALVDLARRLTARGVRDWTRGDLAGALAAFQAALAYDPDAAWPRWNLARLHVRQARPLDALTEYEALQESLPAALRPTFERELDAVTGRSEADEGAAGFAVPLADLQDIIKMSPQL
jgi:predicted SAM-dependent methyltransferase/tetratricopeptide (TPR) repeat protein